jgi:hypothetical protein
MLLHGAYKIYSLKVMLQMLTKTPDIKSIFPLTLFFFCLIYS